MAKSRTKPLTDSQLVILCGAADRKDLNVLPVPGSLRAKGGALKRVLSSLLARGLIAEHTATIDDDAWRIDEELGRLKLTITNSGLAAIGLAPSTGVNTKPQHVIDKPVKRSRPAQKSVGASRSAANRSYATAKSGCSGKPQRETKAAILAKYLHRTDGATIDELMTASGWQAHSVRGFLSGTIRKKLGLNVTSEKTDDGVRRYRIAP